MGSESTTLFDCIDELYATGASPQWRSVCREILDSELASRLSATDVYVEDGLQYDPTQLSSDDILYGEYNHSVTREQSVIGTSYPIRVISSFHDYARRPLPDDPGPSGPAGPAERVLVTVDATVDANISPYGVESETGISVTMTDG